MTLRHYLALMIFSTALCWFAWGLVLLNVDPFQTLLSGFAFFYFSLFLALVGTLSLFVFAVYHFFYRDDSPLFRYVQRSFHDGVIGSSLLTLLLFLQGQRLLRWWSLTLFIALVAIWIGFRLSTNESKPNQQSSHSSFV
ncbi:MAG: hypothetical protein AAB408_00265 [Patescibacteria group bacterium]